jgi:hypothetical protein
MNPTRYAVQRRIAASALIALPVTIALLFVMTQLILPSNQDRIVTRMIQNIEFQRAVPPPLPAQIQVFELPPPVEIKPAPTEAISTAEDVPKDEVQTSNESLQEDAPAHIIDWWAEARRLTQESGEEEFKRWMLEQGYVRYVSVMQGSMPITNSVRGTLPPSQEEATGYMNSFGDLEFKISENCVMQTQVAARFDFSDFGRNLPMRVTCKQPKKVEYSFDRYDRK